MENQFSRTELLIGADALQKLQNARVIVFGVGGVGGYAVEALARAGVGAIDLVDNDNVSVSNINRQIIATHKTVGMSKVDAAENRCLEINPSIKIIKHKVFYLPETENMFDLSQYDYVIDAIDTVAGKLALIENSKKSGVPIICSMGAGNKLDPTAFEVADISKTSVCPLAKAIRVECRKRGLKNIKCVYSKEPAIKPLGEIESNTNRHAPASISFVPSVAGLIIAGEVIKDITGVKNEY